MVNQRGPQYFHEWAPVLTITLLYFYFIPTFNDSLSLSLIIKRTILVRKKGKRETKERVITCFDVVSAIGWSLVFVNGSATRQFIIYTHTHVCVYDNEERLLFLMLIWFIHFFSSSSFIDLTPAEQQLLVEIRRRKTELLHEIQVRS